MGATFAPTSGTSTYEELTLIPTINQTGGANGITRGLYINPTLTAAADFRALEITAGQSIFGGNVIFGTDNTYDIGANGATRPRTGYFGTSILAGSSFLNGSSVRIANSAGDITLSGSTLYFASGTLVAFGGTTSSFPAIKRTTTGLIARLADDSADTTFQSSISNLTAAQTTYNGSVAGTAIWSMPFQGSSYKKFIIYYNSLHDAGGTITFPTAFSKTPTIYGDSAATGITTASTTTLTIALTALTSGFAIVEGY